MGGSLGTGETVISNLSNPDVFFFEPDNVNPNYVDVKLEVSVNGREQPDRARRRLRAAEARTSRWCRRSSERSRASRSSRC